MAFAIYPAHRDPIRFYYYFRERFRRSRMYIRNEQKWDISFGFIPSGSVQLHLSLLSAVRGMGASKFEIILFKEMFT